MDNDSNDNDNDNVTDDDDRKRENEELTKQPSIYTLIVIHPSISRWKNKGSYWTRETFQALALFALTCVIQLGLTCIGGMNILDEHLTSTKNLITYGDDNSHHSFGIELKMKALEQEWRTNPETAFDPNNFFSSDGGEPLCCRGKQCAAVDLPCCPSKVRKTNTNTTAFIFPDESNSNFKSSHPSSFLTRSQKPGHASSSSGAKSKVVSKQRETGDISGAKLRTSALCTMRTSRLDCSPQSAALVHAWDDLDVNGDGIWSVEEARDDAANLACRLGVHLEDIFQSACRGIEQDSQETATVMGWSTHGVPDSIISRQAIPLEWFEVWRGIAAICVNTDPAVCSELVARGFFNGAMDPINFGRRGGVAQLDSAMHYCNRLVRPGGLCDTALPGTYALYRLRVKDTCGHHSFQQGPRYVNPHDPYDTMGTVTVSYSTQLQYQTTHHWAFRLFLALILYIWLSSISEEFKDILLLFDFLLNFPVHSKASIFSRSTRERMIRWRSRLQGSGSLTPTSSEALTQSLVFGEEELIEAEPAEKPVRFRILQITKVHWYMCFFTFIVRAFLFFWLGITGTIFLLNNRTYVDLLLNAVALAFVFEIDELLYGSLISQKIKDEVNMTESPVFDSFFTHSGFNKLWHHKETWGFTIIPAVCVAVIVYHDYFIIQPTLESLACLCSLQGPRCQDGRIFSTAWWNTHWSQTAQTVHP